MSVLRKGLQKTAIKEDNFVQQYGGWGLRGSGQKDYNVSGIQKIQFVNSNGSFLIGTKETPNLNQSPTKYSL